MFKVIVNFPITNVTNSWCKFTSYRWFSDFSVNSDTHLLTIFSRMNKWPNGQV